MSVLDPRTIVMLTGLMSGLMAFVLFILRISYPPSIKGLGEWALAILLLFSVGAMTGVLGPSISGTFICIANATLFSGIYLSYLGTQRFLEVQPRQRRGWMIVAFVSLVSAWFTVVDPNYALRLQMSTATQGSLFAMHAWLIWRNAARTYARKFMFAILTVATAIQFARFVATLTHPNVDGLLDSTPIQVYYVTTYTFVLLLYTIGVVLMATERLREELEHLATHDSLTDAFTRRHMNEALAQELERSRRQNRDLSLLAMDLDHFKAINDAYGHQAGDRVLIEFVADVKTLLRRHDQLGRFGGEEFVVLLPETAPDIAAAIAERIRAMMALRNSGCTVSIGVTSRLNDSDTVDAMLARADAAMYRAKAGGRNRVEISQGTESQPSEIPV